MCSDPVNGITTNNITFQGQLTFGLVSIQVKLYRAARLEQVRMYYVQRPEV